MGPPARAKPQAKRDPGPKTGTIMAHKVASNLVSATTLVVAPLGRSLQTEEKAVRAALNLGGPIADHDRALL
jgi:hypothetical protein